MVWWREGKSKWDNYEGDLYLQECSLLGSGWFMLSLCMQRQCLRVFVLFDSVDVDDVFCLDHLTVYVH